MGFPVQSHSTDGIKTINPTPGQGPDFFLMATFSCSLSRCLMFRRSLSLGSHGGKDLGDKDMLSQDVNRHRGRKGERSKPVSNFSTHTAEIHGKFMNLKSTIPCGLAMLGPIRCSGCLLPAKRTEGSFRKQHHVALELPACVDAREVVVAREFQLR